MRMSRELTSLKKSIATTA